MSEPITFTEEDFESFKELVVLSESQHQMDRITARTSFPAFIEKHGKEKCDLMFEELKRREP